MFLITGATGNIGQRVVQQLVERGASVRAMVRDPNKAKGLLDARVEIVTGDLGDAASVRKAMAGAEALFLLSAGASLAQHDELAARAARDARVKRIVKMSTMNLQRADGSAIAAWHSRGEDAVRASGVTWTFVRPTGFMSNALAWAPSLKADKTVRASTGTGKVAVVHPDDIADVSVAALTTDLHDRGILDLTGPEAMDYAAMVSEIDPAAKFIAITDEEALERLLTAGLPRPVAAALVSLWGSVREGKLATVTSTVERVLGRPPRTFAQWVRENADAFRAAR